MKYVQNSEADNKEKMIKDIVLSGVGILTLLTMGMLGLMESSKNDAARWL